MKLVMLMKMCLNETYFRVGVGKHLSDIQWRPLIIIADNVINRLLLSKSVVPKHSI